jgi:hypothetical protein
VRFLVVLSPSLRFLRPPLRHTASVSPDGRRSCPRIDITPSPARRFSLSPATPRTTSGAKTSLSSSLSLFPLILVMSREYDFDSNPRVPWRNGHVPLQRGHTPIFTADHAAFLHEAAVVVEEHSRGEVRGLTTEQFLWVDRLAQQVRSFPAFVDFPFITINYGTHRRSDTATSTSTSFTCALVRHVFVFFFPFPD